MPMLYGNIVDLPFLLVISIQPPDSVMTYDYIQHICSFLDCFALEVIVENIRKSLCSAFGLSSLDGADLPLCAASYLEGIGLTPEEIDAIRANLGK